MADDLFARFRGAAPVDKEGSSGTRQIPVALRETEVLAAVDRVPSLPTVVTQILAMVGKSASTAAELEALIRQDMALAGRLLKLVNSPFYGLAQPVASISQAVSIIGFASLKSLVLAASTSSLLQSDLSSYGFAERGLWKSSVANAALARAIAQRNRTHRDEIEEYFVAAFLKDVGILVLGPLAARSGLRLRKAEPGDEDLQRRERRILGFDHCWAGLKVAERWNLPEQIREAIAHHHRMPADLPPDRVRRLASVRLAERIAANAGIGLAPDHPFDTGIDAVLLAGSGLDQAGFQDLIAQVPRIIASAEMPV
jgi:HD-like signal output (HDOD) protein